MSRRSSVVQDILPARFQIEAGNEWIVDALGCSSAKLMRLAELQAVCEEVIEDLQLAVMGKPQWVQFPKPGGVTGLYLLQESHLACHTFPEHNLATFNLYCCRPREPWPWEEQLQRLLLAADVIVRMVCRGQRDELDRGGSVT